MQGEDLTRMLTPMSQGVNGLVSTINKLYEVESKQLALQAQESKETQTGNAYLEKILKLQIKEGKAEAKEKKRSARLAKRKKADSSILGKVLGNGKQQGKKAQKGFFDHLISMVGGLVSGIGADKLLAALGITAIGGAITAYFTSSGFRDFVNGLVSGMFDAIGRGIKGMANSAADHVGKALGWNPRTNDEKVSKRTPLTDNQIDAAKKELTRRASESSESAEAAGDLTNAMNDLTEKMDDISEITRRRDHDDKELERMREQLGELRIEEADNNTWGIWKPGLQSQIKVLEERIKNTESERDDRNKNIDASENMIRDMLKGNEELLKLLNEGALNVHIEGGGKKEDFVPFTVENFGIQKKQTGGHINVPGTGSGDKVPFMLPGGSFVMNRNASMMLQDGGMVPALLEPGEKVFGPGQWGPMHQMFNSMVPRFQEGGPVGKPSSTESSASSARGSQEPVEGKGTKKEEADAAKELASEGGTGTGTQALLKSAEANLNLMAGQGEQCANATRAVLKMAGHPAHSKATQIGDLDPEGTQYNGLGFAASFAGSDMGSITKDISKVKAGNIMLWKDTYPGQQWVPGAITHVGMAGEGNTQYDHGRSKGWQKRQRDPKNFVAGIDLNGTAGGFNGGGGGGLFSGINGPMGEMLRGVSQLAMEILGGDMLQFMGLGSLVPSAVLQPSSSDSSSYGEGASTEVTGGAKGLLDFIAKYESGGDYNKMYGGDSVEGLTKMTINEVVAYQNEHLKRFPKSAAAGRYQMMEPEVYARKAGLDPATATFSPENQDKMAMVYLNEDGYQQFRNGSMKATTFAKNVSGTWAAMPTPSGKSTYEDDGVNKAGVDYVTYMKHINASKMQSGGIAQMSGGQSQSNSRFKKAQDEFAAAIGEAARPIVIPVPTGGGGGGGGSVNVSSLNQNMAPTLPDGPSTVQSAEYFYRLSLGSVY